MIDRHIYWPEDGRDDLSIVAPFLCVAWESELRSVFPQEIM